MKINLITSQTPDAALEPEVNLHVYKIDGVVRIASGSKILGDFQVRNGKVQFKTYSYADAPNIDVDEKGYLRVVRQGN